MLHDWLWAHFDHQHAAPGAATLQHSTILTSHRVSSIAAGWRSADLRSSSLQMPPATEASDQPASIPAGAMVSATFLSEAVEFYDAQHRA